MAGLLPPSTIQNKVAIVRNATSVDQKITFDSSGIFLLIMSHIGDSNRTSAMAIAVKNYNGTSYSLTSIIESNVGSGFTLSSDNSYIVCSGSSSHKVISAIALNGYASSIIIENL